MREKSPSPATSHPPRSSQSTELTFLCFIAGSHCLSILHMVMCMSALISQFIPLPPYVHMSLLYICISTPALEIGSSVPFFYSPQFFLFLTYFILYEDFLSIHIPTNDLGFLLFMTFSFLWMDVGKRRLTLLHAIGQGLIWWCSLELWPWAAKSLQ